MGDNTEIEVGVEEVVDYLKLTEQFAPALNKVIQRKLVNRAAEERGIEVSEEELQNAADSHRRLQGTYKASDTKLWLDSNGVSLEKFEEYLKTNLLINKFMDALEKDADKEKFLSSDGVRESVRDLIFQDWVENELK